MDADTDPPQPGPERRTGNGVGLAVVFVLLLLPGGYVALTAFVISAFEIGSQVLAVLAAVVAGVGALCGLMALSARSSGQADRARQLMTWDFLITAAAVVGVLAIPTHGE